MEYATLNNGVKMPMAGIGTFLLSPDEAEASVLSALQCGYRLIDTANAYVNEKAVGRAMKKSGLPREEIFLETKLWPSFYEQADAVEKTLERLDTDYIDLLLIHQPAGNYIAGYKLMEKAYREGKVRAIGLSNFTVEQIQEILGICEVSFRRGILSAMATERSFRSRCSRSWPKSMANPTPRSSCAGIFRTATLSSPAPKIRPISRTISICLTFPSQGRKWQGLPQWTKRNATISAPLKC